VCCTYKEDVPRLLVHLPVEMGCQCMSASGVIKVAASLDNGASARRPAICNVDAPHCTRRTTRLVSHISRSSKSLSTNEDIRGRLEHARAPHTCALTDYAEQNTHADMVVLIPEHNHLDLKQCIACMCLELATA
jgi:hypothetical protein